MKQRLDERKHSSYLLMIVRREEEVGTNIILPGRGNGNFTFIAIGTIMNIMMIYVSDE